MSSSFDTLAFEVRERVAYVRFTTPRQLNSIDEPRLAELRRVVDAVQGDAGIRALAFTGEGKAFCVGLNYDLLQKAFHDIGYFESVVRRFNAILLDLESLPVPVIAAVNGYARAGGIELALACDFILIADEAKIGDVHAQYGVMPGGGATQRLPRRVGEQKAKEIIYLANWLSGPEAAACGLALRSVPLAELPAAVESMLATLRHRPRALSAALKRCLHAARHLEGREGIEFETREFVRYMGQEPYGREGYRASLEGREPSWY